MQIKRSCQGVVAMAILLWIWAVSPLWAQEEGLTLRLRRDFGSAVGVQIRGTFSYHVTGPANLERVVFLLDGEPIGEDREPPFRLQFRTESYETGLRTLSAVGYTSRGSGSLPSLRQVADGQAGLCRSVSSGQQAGNGRFSHPFWQKFKQRAG